MELAIQASESEAKWPVPFGASVDTWKMLISAFYREGADRNYVKFDTAAAKTGQSVDSLKRVSRFITFSGFMTKNENEEYRFTEYGANYAKALAEKDTETLKKSLGKVLMSSPVKEIYDFVQIRQTAGKTISYEDLFNKIKGSARIPDDPKYTAGVNPAYKTAIDTMTDMFIVAGWIPDSIKPVSATSEKVKRVEGSRKTARKITKSYTEKDTRDETLPAGVEELKWGGVRIWLPKDDPDALKKASSLLDTYRRSQNEP